MSEFGDLLRTIRLAKGIGVRELARLTFVSPSMITHLEFDRCPPPARVVSLICTAFGLSQKQRKAWMRLAAKAHGFDV